MHGCINKVINKALYVGASVMGWWSTHKVLLELLHLLFVALKAAVVHGSALDGDLASLQVHLLQLYTLN